MNNMTRADRALIERITTSESPLTVFVNKDGSYLVMYHKTVQCHRYLRCGRVPLFVNVNKNVTKEQKKAMLDEIAYLNGRIRQAGNCPNTINKP